VFESRAARTNSVKILRRFGKYDRDARKSTRTIIDLWLILWFRYIRISSWTILGYICLAYMYWPNGDLLHTSSTIQNTSGIRRITTIS